MKLYRFRRVELDIGDPPERCVAVETQSTMFGSFWWRHDRHEFWRDGKRLDWDSALEWVFDLADAEKARREKLRYKPARKGPWWP